MDVTPKGAEVVPKLIEVESACCRFFDLSWDPSSNRFSVAVQDGEQEPALNAIAFALELQMLTLFGVAALSFMMLMYALERRGPRFTAAFACGCALSSAYGFASGAWPLASWRRSGP